MTRIHDTGIFRRLYTGFTGPMWPDRSCAGTMFDPDLRSDTPIDPEAAAAMLRFVRPRPEELSWQAIPWQTSIPAAIELAERERKPVFLWTMNGNPLGLT